MISLLSLQADRTGAVLREFASHRRSPPSSNGRRGGAEPPYLPRGLPVGDVELLLESCDRATTLGRRDFAILMLLVRLGLRGGEVAGLRLDDLDWRAGVIVIRGKRSRIDRLPLPADVGQAVADYCVAVARTASAERCSCA